MATLQFKTKIQSIRPAGGGEYRAYFQMPRPKRSHCDMSEFRKSQKFGSIANSDLFEGVLRKELRNHGLKVGNNVYLDALPATAQVDEDDFLATVTITLEEPSPNAGGKA